MSYLAGCDYSTHSIDIVLIDEDTREARRTHLELGGADAWARIRNVRDVMPARDWWRDEGVLAIGIEIPLFRSTNKLQIVLGAILATLPAWLLVQPLDARTWRKLAGMPGNASKADVSAYAGHLLGHFRLGERMTCWSQDSYDAYCLARAVEQLVQTEAAA